MKRLADWLWVHPPNVLGALGMILLAALPFFVSQWPHVPFWLILVAFVTPIAALVSLALLVVWGAHRAGQGRWSAQ